MENIIITRMQNSRQKTGSNLRYKITVTRQANNPQDKLTTPMVLNFLRAPRVPYMGPLMGGPPGAPAEDRLRSTIQNNSQTTLEHTITTRIQTDSGNVTFS